MEGPVALFSLKWNNQPAHFSLGLKTLLQNDYLTDVTLCSSTGECVRSHRLVLALTSPYFKELFQMPQHQGDAGTIVILPGVRHKDLLNIIKFIYTGETRMPQEDLNRFLATCNALKLSINAGKLGVGDSKQQNNQKQELQQLQRKTPTRSPPPPLRTVTKPVPPLLTPKQLKKKSAAISVVPNGPAASPLYGIDASSFCETELVTPNFGGDEGGDHQQDGSQPGHQGVCPGPNNPKENGNMTKRLYDSDNSDQDQEEEDVQNDHKKIKREVEQVQAKKVADKGPPYPRHRMVLYTSDYEGGMTDEDDVYVSDSENDDKFDTNQCSDDMAAGDGANDSVDIQDSSDDLEEVRSELASGRKQKSFGSRSVGGKSVSVCEICGAKFHRKDSYRRHKKSHGAHQYQCEDCGRGFYRRDLYNRHLEAQHGKPKVL